MTRAHARGRARPSMTEPRWTTSSPSCSPPASGRRSTAAPPPGSRPLQRAVEMAHATRPRRRGHRRRLAARRVPRRRRPLRRRHGRARAAGRRRARASPSAGCSPRSRPPRSPASTASSGGTPTAAPSTTRALELAEDAPEARFDALLGLAADAVGLGEADDGRRTRSPRPRALASGRSDWWRQRVRLDWVRAEIALLRERRRRGGGSRAPRPSRSPRRPARRATWPRACCSAASPTCRPATLDEAAATLRRAATLAESLGAVPARVAGPGRARRPRRPDAPRGERGRARRPPASIVRQIADDLPARARRGLARPPRHRRPARRTDAPRAGAPGRSAPC